MSRYQWTSDPLATPPPISDYHRRQVTSLLAELAPPNGGRLAVLGAGPCHDLDLAHLQTRWPHIDLVDIDPAIVHRGVAAQGFQPHGIHVLAQDLLGAGQPIDPPKSAEQAADFLQRVSTATWDAVANDYDAIASTCLLSQLVKTVLETLGAQHPLFVPTVQALRRLHLQRMAEALRPGGTAVLLVDFVSSDTLPALFSATPHNLPELLGQALQANNVFHGMNPGLILKVARETPELRDRIQQVQMSPPWIWRTGNMAYAVVAIKFVRRAPPVTP